jgi:hypothetical protein
VGGFPSRLPAPFQGATYSSIAPQGVALGYDPPALSTPEEVEFLDALVDYLSGHWCKGFVRSIHFTFEI